MWTNKIVSECGMSLLASDIDWPVCCVTASYLTRNFSLKREQMISNLRIILAQHWSQGRKEGREKSAHLSFLPSLLSTSQHRSNILTVTAQVGDEMWLMRFDFLTREGSLQNRHSALKLKVTIRSFHLKILKLYFYWNNKGLKTMHR